jgi:flagellar basal-body rod protein FlgF
LDVAIDGKGWIAVRTSDGAEAYTRAGDLKITPEGLLQTGAGLSVLGDSGNPITVPPARKLTIGGDGTISIIPQGGIPTTSATVDRIRLVNPDPSNLEKRTDGLIYSKQGTPAPTASADVKLVQGALESSNVNSMSAMVDMIELSRNFELQIKAMKSADDNAAATSKLMVLA